MSFTNQMLGALGTATGALAAGQHIAEQKKANEAAEAEKEVQIKDLEYANDKDAVEYKKKMVQKRKKDLLFLWKKNWLKP